MNFVNDEDCFGFTKQTAMILKGLGIEDLIPQFKNKNISTQALSQLPKQDLITLGVNEHTADIIVKQFVSHVNKYKSKVLSNLDKYDINSGQFIDIIKSGKQQLLFMQAFITYAHLKLLQKPTDYIIDCNNNIRASEALCTVINCVCQEINHLEEKMKELSVYVYENDERKKGSKGRTLGLISGIGLSACFIFTWSYISGYLRCF